MSVTHQYVIESLGLIKMQYVPKHPHFESHKPSRADWMLQSRSGSRRQETFDNTCLLRSSQKGSQKDRRMPGSQESPPLQRKSVQHQLVASQGVSVNRQQGQRLQPLHREGK